MSRPPLTEGTEVVPESPVVGPIILSPGMRRAVLAVDATTLLTMFLALQFLVPARLVLSGLGGAGRPSNVLGLGLLLLVAGAAVQTCARRRTIRQPVRWIIGGYALVQLIGYAVGDDRGLVGIEARSADRWMLLSLGLVGLALAVCEGVGRSRLDVLLRRLTYFAAVSGLVGLVQGVTGFNPVRYISLPGLSLNAGIIGIGERGGLPRVAGTASHFIELGVVSAMLLPLALHYLLFAGTRRRWLASMVTTALLLGGIGFSLSRSAILALAVAGCFLFLGWSWRWRLGAVVLGGTLVGVVALSSTRWVETMLSLFVDAEDDNSIQSRLEDYPVMLGFFSDRPWLGRGVGTFLPEEYILVDNQYLLTLVGGGLLGMVGLLLVLVGPVLVTFAVRARAADAEDAHLALALGAACAVAAVTSGTFDSFGFTTFGGVLFLVVGAVGALYGAALEGSDSLEDTDPPHDRQVTGVPS